MSKQQVLGIMGEPHAREAYKDIEFLIYRTDPSLEARGKNGEMTPIAIVGGRLDGWGRNYYDTAIRSRADVRVQVERK